MENEYGWMVRDFLLLSLGLTLSLPTSILIPSFSLAGPFFPTQIMPTLGSYRKFQEQYATIHQTSNLLKHHHQEINVQVIISS